MSHILVVDDERSMRELLQIVLRRSGHQVTPASSGDEALAIVQRAPPDLVVQDLKMPGMPGLELISRLKALDPDMPIIVITAFSTWDSTVEAMRRGAYDYVKKPFDNEDMRESIERALARRKTLAEVRGRPEMPELRLMVGQSQPMREVLDVVRRVAPTESTVLIQGESGTGKELIARLIHYTSSRAVAPFISVNCGGFPESLLESELFGHLRGTFTGAHADKKGLFQVSDGGTFFLDEVGEMPLALQVKLLRVLEERQFYPVGGTRPVRIDVRFVCATNRDLAEEVRAGRFRSDLYFRLNVIPVSLPPLRARAGDIPLLAGFFMRKHAAALGREITSIAPAVQSRLEAHAWPGNVRELENVIQRAIALSRGPVIEDAMLGEDTPASFGRGPLAASEGLTPPPARAPSLAPAARRALDETWRIPMGRTPTELPGLRAAPGAASMPTERGEDEGEGPDAPGAPIAASLPPLPAIPATGFDLEAQLAALERRYIEEALGRSGGNLTRAAEVLGITFRSIRYKVKKLGIRE